MNIDEHITYNNSKSVNIDVDGQTQTVEIVIEGLDGDFHDVSLSYAILQHLMKSNKRFGDIK